MHDRPLMPELAGRGGDLQHAPGVGGGHGLGAGAEQVLGLALPELLGGVGLEQRKAKNLLGTGAEAVAAANPGCVLQIAASARELGHELPVVHPVEILYASMKGGHAPWQSS